MDGDARSDSDGGGVDELTRTGTDEGGAQHGTGLPVDDQLDLTVGVAVQEGNSGGRGVADLSSDDVLAGVAGPLSGRWGR